MSAIDANLARSGATLDDVQGTIGNLYDLLDVLFDQVTDAEFGNDQSAEKSRISSLVWVSRDLAKRAMDEFNANTPVIIAARKLATEGRR